LEYMIRNPDRENYDELWAASL